MGVVCLRVVAAYCRSDKSSPRDQDRVSSTDTHLRVLGTNAHCYLDCRLPLPQEVPLTFKTLPEYFIEDLVEYWAFVLQYVVHSPDPISTVLNKRAATTLRL